MTLPNLINHPDTTDMTALKKWREIRSNSRDSLLAKNQDESIDVDCTAGGTIVLTVNQREPVQLIRLTGTPGAGYTVEFADGNKQFEIENVSGQSATIDSATGAASPPVIATGNTALIQLRGIELTVMGIVGLQSGALLHSGQVNPTGSIDFVDYEVKRAFLVDHATKLSNPSSSSGTLTLDMEVGNWFEVTLTEDVTVLNLDNPPFNAFNLQLEDGSGNLQLEDGSGNLILEGTNVVGSIYLIAKQDGTGGWEITWPASVAWEQSTEESPKQSLGSNQIDIYWFFTLNGGTSWFGSLLGYKMG